MAIVPDLTDIGSGFNRTPINTNFDEIVSALQDALSRNGVTPNQMEADIDLNDNDLLNVNDLDVARLFVGGTEFVPADVQAQGDKGWGPSFAVVADGDRRVLQLTAWVGGEGDVPTDNIGEYVGSSGMVVSIASAVDIRGAQGASGAGTGDMLAAQNLNDVASKPTAFANIKQDATETATGVVELATSAETVTGTDTVRATHPAGVKAAIDDALDSFDGGATVLLVSGTVSSASNLNLVLSSYTAYRSFKLVITDWYHTSASTALRMRVSGDAGSSYDNGSNDYSRTDTLWFDSSTTTQGATGDSYMIVSRTVGSFLGSGVDIEITFANPMNSSRVFKMNAVGNVFTTANCGIHSFGARNSSKLIDAIRLFPSSGNISSGKYALYGLT